MKKIVVTGGGGFIGSHTVDLLLEKGYRVIVIDSLITGKLSYVNLFHPNIEFIQRDILDYPKFSEKRRDPSCELLRHMFCRYPPGDYKISDQSPIRLLLLLSFYPTIVHW